MTRLLALGLAVNRIAFGAGFLAMPESAKTTWIGARAAGRTETKLFVRALGARDVGLGLGALRALVRRDPQARTWMAAHAIADGTDLVTTFVSRRDLPERQATIAIAVAGASTAIAALSALALPSGPDETLPARTVPA